MFTTNLQRASSWTSWERLHRSAQSCLHWNLKRACHEIVFACVTFHLCYRKGRTQFGRKCVSWFKCGRTPSALSTATRSSSTCTTWCAVKVSPKTRGWVLFSSFPHCHVNLSSEQVQTWMSAFALVFKHERVYCSGVFWFWTSALCSRIFLSIVAHNHSQIMAVTRLRVTKAHAQSHTWCIAQTSLFTKTYTRPLYVKVIQISNTRNLKNAEDTWSFFC